MNNQEAIEKILKINHTKSGLDFDDEVRVITVIDIINQIDEPEKPVIPQFVADKIEYCKNSSGYSLFHAMDYCFQFKESADWLEDNQEFFARAWFYGYTVEKPKLYTVEIPNPALDNLEFVIVLKRLRGRVCLVSTYDYMGRELSDEYRLTESEIRKDFEWAWQAGFAKEVE